MGPKFNNYPHSGNCYGLSFGTKYGSIIGGIWGVITFIRAFVWPTSPLAAIVFVNPLISILPKF